MGAVAGAPFDPVRSYTTNAREKLIDSLLDWSHMLPLKPGEQVTIVAKDMLDVQTLQPTRPQQPRRPAS